VFYPRKMMRSNPDRLPTLTLRVALQALAVGTVLAIFLLIIHGPVWTIYLAGLVVGGPYAAWQVWVIDPVRIREAEARRAARERADDPGTEDDSA
jgi:hypothetical protein